MNLILTSRAIWTSSRDNDTYRIWVNPLFERACAVGLDVHILVCTYVVLAWTQSSIYVLLIFSYANILKIKIM